MSRLYLTAILLMLSFHGCGSGGATAPPPSEVEIGKAVRTQVQDLLERLRKNPKNGANQIAIALEGLNSYAGQFGPEFQNVVDAAKALQGLYESKAPPLELESSQGKLQSAADALPH